MHGLSSDAKTRIRSDIREVATKLESSRPETDKTNKDVLYELGLCFLDGVGVEKNPEKAIVFFERAKGQDHKGAIAQLDYLHLKSLGLGMGNERVSDFIAFFAKEPDNVSSSNEEPGKGSSVNKEPDKGSSVNKEPDKGSSVNKEPDKGSSSNKETDKKPVFSLKKPQDLSVPESFRMWHDAFLGDDNQRIQVPFLVGDEKKEDETTVIPRCL